MISSISVESQSQISANPEWKPATWDDYLSIRDDPTMMLYVWFTQHPEQVFCSFSRCQIEKPRSKAGVPDLVLYIGDDYPRWEEGERRYINLEYHQVPNLVGEVADTTLASDLDEKKHLYAELGLPEYWVIDVRGKQVIAFILAEDKTYKEIHVSVALFGLPIKLVEQTIEKLEQESNINAANWFAQKITNL